MRIKDMVVGSRIETSLAVISAEEKQTAMGKPYLLVELTDGEESIRANLWDWKGTTVPPSNIVVKINASVTEWNGNKQLKLNSIARDTVVPLSTFAPQGDVDIDLYLHKARSLINDVDNPLLKDLATQALDNNMERWGLVPAAKRIHHAYIAGTLKHSVDTALLAQAISTHISSSNMDLCTVGGLLHDYGKLWTYGLDGVVIGMTDTGMLLDHIVLGCIKLEDLRTQDNSQVVDLIQHIISSHHGKLEYGSPVTPVCLEAWIVSAADSIDSKAGIFDRLDNEGKLTQKEWALGNKQMFTQEYIEGVLNVK